MTILSPTYGYQMGKNMLSMIHSIYYIAMNSDRSVNNIGYYYP